MFKGKLFSLTVNGINIFPSQLPSKEYVEFLREKQQKWHGQFAMKINSVYDKLTTTYRPIKCKVGSRKVRYQKVVDLAGRKALNDILNGEVND